jgi:hypothetical protein
LGRQPLEVIGVENDHRPATAHRRRLWTLPVRAADELAESGFRIFQLQVAFSPGLSRCSAIDLAWLYSSD